VVEKLLRILQQKQTGDLSEYLIFRFYNVFLMIQVFKIEGDYKRILKYLNYTHTNLPILALETKNKSNL